MPEFVQMLQRLWRKVPFRHVLAATVFLAVVGEQYPFSNFPMYSHLDKEADVLYVTDQTDRVLPMEKLFGTSSSTQKKVFITELKEICNPKGRDTRDALPEERSAAGAKLGEKLFPKLKPHNLAQVGGEVKGLRLYYKVFTVESGAISTGAPQLVAEKAL
ncbi:hypothetical protein [Verrucomicrobium spinosum]|uniref:hypothetical protein n=1 Tax=Verrucomicrobium spinosum TaxID=2736 RepID=UPI00017460A4|nr:hypothetical protein [Verrucomicrobium spinosum]